MLRYLQSSLLQRSPSSLLIVSIVKQVPTAYSQLQPSLVVASTGTGTAGSFALYDGATEK
jgi:hypothetical protein